MFSNQHPFHLLCDGKPGAEIRLFLETSTWRGGESDRGKEGGREQSTVNKSQENGESGDN